MNAARFLVANCGCSNIERREHFSGISAAMLTRLVFSLLAFVAAADASFAQNLTARTEQTEIKESAGNRVRGSYDLRMFADGATFAILDDIVFHLGTNQRLIIPRGFVTDLTSVPSLFRSAVPKTGKHAEAAILHDYLYWDQGCSRTQADQIFMATMKASDISWLRRHAINFGVKFVGGAAAWETNKEAKQGGLSRVIPEEYLRRLKKRRVGWQRFRKYLHERGVRSAKSPIHSAPHHCNAKSYVREHIRSARLGALESIRDEQKTASTQ